MTALDNFNNIFKNDPYIQALCNSLGLEQEEVEKLCQVIYLNMFFNTMDEETIQLYAEIMDIVIDTSLSIEDQRSIVMAKWKSKGKCTEELIQSVCDSWRNGEIIVDFENTINISFNSQGGVPSDIEALKIALNKVKPAYLSIEYTFNWLYWDLWESWEMSWDELESKNLTWDEFEATVNRP